MKMMEAEDQQRKNKTTSRKSSSSSSSNDDSDDGQWLHPDADTKSMYRGVFWNDERNKWESRICIRGVVHYLGLANTEVEAAQNYDL